MHLMEFQPPHSPLYRRYISVYTPCWSPISPLYQPWWWECHMGRSMSILCRNVRSMHPNMPRVYHSVSQPRHAAQALDGMSAVKHASKVDSECPSISRLLYYQSPPLCFTAKTCCASTTWDVSSHSMHQRWTVNAQVYPVYSTTRVHHSVLQPRHSAQALDGMSAVTPCIKGGQWMPKYTQCTEHCLQIQDNDDNTTGGRTSYSEHPNMPSVYCL